MHRAVFMPSSAIMCAPCHNALSEAQRGRPHREPVVVPMDEVTDLSPYLEDNEEPRHHTVRCDTCDKEAFVVRTDVALCQRVARYVGASVWQTGGMCVAAGETVSASGLETGAEGSPGVEVLVTDAESDNPDEVIVGVYRMDAEGCNVDDGEIVYEGSDLDAIKAIFERVRATRSAS